MKPITSVERFEYGFTFDSVSVRPILSDERCLIHDLKEADTIEKSPFWPLPSVPYCVVLAIMPRSLSGQRIELKIS